MWIRDRVQELHLAAAGNAARGHLTLAFGGNVDGDGLLTVKLGDESLDVQDDLYDILLYTCLLYTSGHKWIRTTDLTLLRRAL